jgi:hypothetical protein
MFNISEFIRSWNWRQPKKHVKLDVINAIELKPEATYILVADKKAVTREDITMLMGSMRKAGVKNVVGFMLGGAPEDSIQFVEHHKRDRKRSNK